MARKRDGLYERRNKNGKRTAWIWDVMLDGERVVRTFDGKLSRSVAKEEF
jgi:hypothetical protein